MSQYSQSPPSPEFMSHLREGMKSGSYSFALAEYDRAWVHARSEVERAMVQQVRGLARFKMGHKELGLRLLEDAIRLHHENPEPRVHLGKFLLEMGDFRIAMEELAGAEAVLLEQDEGDDVSFLLEPFRDFKRDVMGLSEASISGYVNEETEKVRSSRTFPFPRDARINDFLSRFYCDPVSRMWRGLDPIPEEESGGAGTADGSATGPGFVAAVACVKSKKFSDVIGHCTDEIDNPNGRFVNEARLLRGTLYLLWREDEKAFVDFKFIIDAPDASNQIKSCAHLKAGMVHNMLASSADRADHYAKAEEVWKENADIYYYAALGLTNEDAKAVLKKGVEVCPDPKQHPLLHAMDLSTRTLSYSNSMFYDEKKRAEETVAKLKEMEGNGLLDTAACYAEFAEAVRCLGDVKGMGTAYDKATELAGGYNIYQLRKIKAMFKKLDDAAREWLIKRFEKFTDDPDPDVAAYAFELIFEHKMELGKYKEGFAAVDKAIQLAPNIFEVKRLWTEKANFKYVVRLAELTGGKWKACVLKFKRVCELWLAQ